MTEFNVCQFFIDDTHEYVRRNVSAVDAVSAARHYTNNVATRLGVVTRVIITDSDDYCVFEWKHGLGQTFPPLTPTTKEPL
jgi:hypothetical protein